MITFKQSDLDELRTPYSYLSDVIIEFYFTYLASIYPSDSILYVPPSISFLLLNSCDGDVVEDCLKPLELMSKNLIFFPVCSGAHWSLLVYHRKSNRFVHHDSGMMRMNNGAARELYLTVKGRVHDIHEQGIKSRNRRDMDGPSDDPMWRDEIEYDCGSYGFPQMRREQNAYDSGLYVGSQMWREKNAYDGGLYVGSQMGREMNGYDPRFYEDYDLGLYDAYDNYDLGLYDAYDCRSYDVGLYDAYDNYDLGLYDAYDCGSYDVRNVPTHRRREKNEYDYGIFICPKTPEQKNGFDCGLYVMAIAEAICRWFREEYEEKSWIRKINEVVNDSLVYSMRNRILKLIRNASVGRLGTVWCTIEGERSVDVCRSNSDVSKGLEHDDNIVVTIEGLNKEESDGDNFNFWDDIDWSSDHDCETISEGRVELVAEEGEKEFRTLCISPPPSIAVGQMVVNDSAPLIEKETGNEKVSTESRSLVREEVVADSGMEEPSLSCDSTPALSCIVEENKPVKDVDMNNSAMLEKGCSGLKTEDTGDICGSTSTLSNRIPSAFNDFLLKQGPLEERTSDIQTAL